MYIDFSVQKIAAIALVCLVMFFAVSATSVLKENLYGSTPSFASVGLAAQELALRARYTFESAFWRFPEGATAAALSSQSTFEMNAGDGVARAIPVLTYHRIVSDASDQNNVTVSAFRDQMLTLKRAGWETITLREYEEFMAGERQLPKRSFLITFDDGAKDSFYPVDPLFAALDYGGVIYIIAAAAHTPESVYYLSPVEIKRMIDTGRWEIGSHSYDGHRPYPADAKGTDGIFFADKLWLPGKERLEANEEFEARVRDDLLHAKEALEAEYGVPINTFAFPLGNETGIEGANNFPEGAAITEQTASEIYDIGFLQTNNNGYTYNVPGDQFISRRIHVDHDWNGARLLREMENGLEKPLPYEDDFSQNKGWISSWGSLDIGRNNLSLTALPDASSASAFLDGSGLWNDYSYAASARWRSGSVFLLADLVDSRTYHSCAYSDGVVRVQSTRSGVTSTLAEFRDPSITYRDDAQLGIRVHGAVIECLWEYESVVEAYERDRGGGIGLQIWHPDLGSASLQVSEILVRPYETPSE